MSFWSNNPEKYTEIAHQGMVSCLDRYLAKAGFEVPGEWLDGFLALVETASTEPQLRTLYNEIERLANKDVLRAEQDYFGGLADNARK
jgi:hypothetical protein